MTKQFRLNSNTQDIYLTQWESESLPEESAIIGKYQTMGITPEPAVFGDLFPQSGRNGQHHSRAVRKAAAGTEGAGVRRPYL